MIRFLIHATFILICIIPCDARKSAKETGKCDLKKTFENCKKTRLIIGSGEHVKDKYPYDNVISPDARCDFTINDDYTSKQKKDWKHVLNPDCDLDISNLNRLKVISEIYKEQFDEVIFERVGNGLANFVAYYNLDEFIALFSGMLKDQGKLIYQSFRVCGYDGLVLDGEERDFGIPELMLSLTRSITGTDRAGLEDKVNKYRNDFLLGSLDENPDEDLDIQSKYAIFLNSPKHPLTFEQYEFIKKYYNKVLTSHNYQNIAFRIKQNHRNSLLYYLEMTAIKNLHDKTNPQPKLTPTITAKPILKKVLIKNFVKLGLMLLSARYNLYCIAANEISKNHYNDLLNTKLKLNVGIMPNEFRDALENPNKPSPPLIQDLLKHYSYYILAENKKDKSFFIIAVSLDSPKQLISEMFDGLGLADHALFLISLDLQEQDYNKIISKRSGNQNTLPKSS